MENAINTLRIQNFKSIKDVTMQPRRVNLIIGQPNVGKSNILEAMSLLGGIVYERTEKFMSSFIRYEEPRQLFYDNLVVNTISVETNASRCLIRKAIEQIGFEYVWISLPKIRLLTVPHYAGGGKAVALGEEEYDIFKEGKSINHNRPSSLIGSYKLYIYTEVDYDGKYGVNGTPNTFHADTNYFKRVHVKPYVFHKNRQSREEYAHPFLQPPYGANLINIIQGHPEFRKEISDLFAAYNLKLLLRVDERRLEVIKDLEGVIYSYPYSSIADTLQRIIFYLAAIESNDDSVLLFEEPEAHSYPVYVSMLGRRMVESRNNQFFVATHSPYLITEVLEQMLTDDEQAKELAIFVAYYEDYQTKVKQLSDEEMRDIRNDGVDVFYNMSRYIPRPVNG